MPMRIKPGPFPPGGFEFVDPKTNMRFNGMSADLTLQARNVIAHRLANPRIYSQGNAKFFSLVEVTQEIVDYVCSRNPKYCLNVPANVHVTSPQRTVLPAGSCVKCGANEWEAVVCKSCGGGRLKGYKCKKCGAERKR